MCRAKPPRWYLDPCQVAFFLHRSLLSVPDNACPHTNLFVYALLIRIKENKKFDLVQSDRHLKNHTYVWGLFYFFLCYSNPPLLAVIIKKKKKGKKNPTGGDRTFMSGFRPQPFDNHNNHCNQLKGFKKKQKKQRVKYWHFRQGKSSTRTYCCTGVVFITYVQSSIWIRFSWYDFYYHLYLCISRLVFTQSLQCQIHG